MRNAAMHRTLPLLILPFVAACAQAVDSNPAPVEPAATVLGAAETCIPVVQIRTSRVRSDRVIVFEMTGSKVYRNTLPADCPGLGFEQSFSYATSLTQLCSTDIIHVLQHTGGSVHEAAGCGLGQFVPVSYVR
jgi:hypothetical protein